MIDILYVAFNRLEYTRESFRALIDHTDWSLVERLFVNDDGSTDGTWEHLCEAMESVPVPVLRRFQGSSRGPVAAMNWYLDNISEIACDAADHRKGGCWRCGDTGTAKVETFAKIDNDMIVCPGWLGEMLAVMSANPGLDILGMEPMVGPAAAAPASRGFEDARWIGGKGLIRARAFELCRPTPSGRNGYQGFTQWQAAHPQVTKGWVRPELPVFGLDQLDFEPWRSLAVEYEEKGWARRWPAYEPGMFGYWDWWLKADPSRAGETADPRPAVELS